MMKKCCLMFTNLLKCAKKSKTSVLKLIEENNLLLPKTESTRGVIERNEINTFGKVPLDVKGILDLTLFTNSIVYKIVCGKEHCLILMEDRSLFCFGYNTEGQLGLPIEANKIISSLFKLKIEVKGLNKFVIEDIAIRNNYSLLLLRSNDNKTQLIRLGINKEDKYKGVFDDVNVIHIEPITDVNIKRIFAFDQRTLLLTASNEIYVGGINFESTVLDGYLLLTHFDKEIKSISLGSNHCIVLTDEGEMFGIGDNTYCELGTRQMSQTTFTQITFKEFDSSVKKVTVGARHSMFLLSNGKVFCVGDNSESQCSGFTSRIQNPMQIDLGVQSKIVDIHSGYAHNLIILDNGDILTWGNATEGKLGYNQHHFTQSTPKLLLQLQERCPYKVALGSEMTVISTASYQLGILENQNQKE